MRSHYDEQQTAVQLLLARVMKSFYHALKQFLSCYLF